MDEFEKPADEVIKFGTKLSTPHLWNDHALPNFQDVCTGIVYVSYVSYVSHFCV